MSNIMLSAMAWVTNTVGYAFAKIKEERGQDLLEYAVLVGAIALVAGGALFFILDDSGAFEDFAEMIGNCVSFQETCETP